MTIGRLRATIGLLGLLSLAGCGSWVANGITMLDQENPPVDAGSAGFSTSSGSSCGSGPDGGTADAGPLDLSNPAGSGYTGDWAIQLVQNGTILPLGPPAWDITITDVFLGASQDQTMTMNFCGENVTLIQNGKPTTLGATQVPCLLQTALGKAPVTFAFSEAGFSASNVAWTWGLQNVTNPLTYSLPTTADDPHLWDQDMDGNPGVTLDLLYPVNGLFISRLAIWQFGAGTLSMDEAQTWLTGPLQFTAVEQAVGASDPPPQAISPTIPNATGSVYQMRRVGPSFTCAELLQYQTQIFAGAPGQ